MNVPFGIFKDTCVNYKSKKGEIRKYLQYGDVRKKFKFRNNFFDLVISFNCLHNLEIFYLEKNL